MNHKLGSQILKWKKLERAEPFVWVEVRAVISPAHQQLHTMDQDHPREDGFLKEKVAVCQLQRNYKNKFLAENLKG